MVIEEKWFRRVTEDFLIMRRSVSAYRSLQKTHTQLINKDKALSEDERNMLKPAIRSIEEQMEELATKIADEAGKRYPTYNRLVEELGIVGNLSAMEALAELIVYFDPAKGFRKAANLHGLFKGKGKIYDGRLRQALQRLTASVNGIQPVQLTARLEKETLFKIWKTYKEEAQGRLAIPAQG